MYKVNYLEPWETDNPQFDCQVVFENEQGGETIICLANDENAGMLVSVLNNVLEQSEA